MTDLMVSKRITEAMTSIQLSMFREWDSLQARRTKKIHLLRRLIMAFLVVKVKLTLDSNGDYCDDASKIK